MKSRYSSIYKYAVYRVKGRRYNDDLRAEILEIFEIESQALAFLRGHDEGVIIGINLETGEPFQ